eukprot:Nitzschia sp. Nitz4//scaffold52_size167869//138678//141366//NITZ4_002292-RA/size167869-processed-gene-0.142-mRNA-1//1//CDS//3329554083//181//frame0
MSSDMVQDDPLIQQHQQLQPLPHLQQSDLEMATLAAVVSQDDDDHDNDHDNDNDNDNDDDSQDNSQTILFTLNNSPPSSPPPTTTLPTTTTTTTTRRSSRRRRNSVAPKAMRMAAAVSKQQQQQHQPQPQPTTCTTCTTASIHGVQSVRLVVKVGGQVIDQGTYHPCSSTIDTPNAVAPPDMNNNNNSNISGVRSVRLVVKVGGQVIDQGEYHPSSTIDTPNTTPPPDMNNNNNHHSMETNHAQSPRKRSWASSTGGTSNITLHPLVRSTPLRVDGTPLRKAKKTLSRTEENAFASLTRVLPLANKAQVSVLETHTQRLFPCLSNAVHAAHSCVVAPILAAFELFGPDASSTAMYETPSKRTRGISNRAMQRTTSGPEPSPLLPLFDALVQLELVLLASDSNRGSDSRKVKRASKQATTRVHFAAFDGSALQPPSDVLEGSHQHQEATIEGLTNVLRVIDTLTTSDTNQFQAATNKLSQLIDYLSGDLFMSEHAQLCADVLSLHSGSNKSMGPLFYPVKRVLRAASSYLDDFRLLLANWQTTLTNQANLELSVIPPSMSWHIRLSDAISQLVRYWLRTQLNPVPDRAPAHCSSQEWMQRVSDIVSLAVEANVGPSLIANAIDDGSLSSLVSNATSHIFEYFGPNLELWKEKMESTPSYFLEGSRLAIAGIAPSKGERSSNKRRRSGPSLTEYSDEEWHSVEGELEIATSFLAAVQGAAFLRELLSVIVEHPDPVYCNAWQDTIQAAAKHLEETPAKVALHSQDSHLVLLQHSPDVLLSTLPGIIDMDKRDACQLALQQFAKRFLMKHAGLRMDAKMTRRKRSYQPYVGNLEYTYELAISKTAFPFVVSLEE